MNKAVLSEVIEIVHQEFTGDGDLSIRLEAWLPEDEWVTPGEGLYFIWQKAGLIYKGQLDSAWSMLRQGYSARQIATTVRLYLNVAAKKFEEMA